MPTAAKIKGVKNVNRDKDIREEMTQIDKEAKSAVTRFRPPQTLENADAGLGVSFPRRIFADDSERDSYIEWKRNAKKEVYGEKRLEKEDYEYEKDKDRNVQYAQWLNWAETYFNLADPAEQRIVEQLMPEYFDERAKQIHEVAELQVKIAELMLRGPRSKDDLFLIWLINSGKLKVPKGAIWAPDKWYAGQDGNNLNRGLFNPHRYVQQAGRPDPAERWKIGATPNTNKPPVFGTGAINFGANGLNTRELFDKIRG